MRIVYSDHTSTFEQLLEKDSALKFHHKNLQLLAIELFKRKNNISDQTKEIFIHDENIKVNRQTPYFRSREIIVRIKNPGLEVYCHNFLLTFSLLITRVKNRFAQFLITLPNTPLGIGSLFNHMIKK